MTLADRIAIMKNGVIQQLDTPHVIYNKPVNLFVAGFIGSPSMNFLKGTISGGTVQVDGLSIPLGTYAFEGAVPADGTPVVLGVRPEHIDIGAAGNAHPFSTDAEIEIVEPMGSDTLGWTKIGKTPAIFRVDSEIDLKVGQKLRIGFDPARGSLFHAESGERL
jgi:multiple sugar transport system ATP-binding protein